MTLIPCILETSVSAPWCARTGRRIVPASGRFRTGSVTSRHIHRAAAMSRQASGVGWMDTGLATSIVPEAAPCVYVVSSNQVHAIIWYGRPLSSTTTTSTSPPRDKARPLTPPTAKFALKVNTQVKGWQRAISQANIYVHASACVFAYAIRRYPNIHCACFDIQAIGYKRIGRIQPL